MRFNMRVIGVISLVIVIIVGLGLFSFTMNLSFLFLRSEDDSKLSQSYSYQYLERNHYLNETNFGYVTHPNEIEPDEYITYQLSEGSQVLISNFGEEEYECFGSCYCVSADGLERRSSSGTQVLTKGIPYLLVALSSAFAVKKARSYFETKCIEEISEECNLRSNVKSSVDDCSPIITENSEETASPSIDEEAGKVQKKVKYFCFGHCLSKTRVKSEQTQKQFEHMRCEKLKKDGHVTISRSVNYKRTTKFVQQAIMKFQKNHLKGHCKENSLLEYSYEHTGVNKRTGREATRILKFKGYGCVARKNYPGTTVAMRNVWCRQVEPKSESVASDYHDSEFLRYKRDWERL